MEDPRIRKFAKFLINHAVYLQKDEKILLELHGKQTGLLKALVEEAYAAAVQKCGPGATVLAMPYGGSTLPVCTAEI